jgi:hypothetical protein
MRTRTPTTTEARKASGVVRRQVGRRSALLHPRRVAGAGLASSPTSRGRSAGCEWAGLPQWHKGTSQGRNGKDQIGTSGDLAAGEVAGNGRHSRKTFLTVKKTDQ